MNRIEHNYSINVQERKSGLKTLQSGPVRISMNLTGGCNIRCRFCHLAHYNYYTHAEMTPDLFLSLDRYLKTASYLVFFSSTEPLFAKHFKEIFSKSKEYDAEKYLSTNGLLMDDDMSEILVDGRLYYLTISIAGTNRESYRFNHGTDGFKKLIDNIRRLNAIKKRYGVEFPRLRLVFVLMKSNMHLLPDAVRLAYDYEFSEGIKITYLKTYTDAFIDELPFHCMDEVIKNTDKAMSLAEKLKVPVSFDGGRFDDLDFKGEIEPHRSCYEPFTRMHIEADGKVRVCPTFSCNEFAGSLKDQSSENIWNGHVYQKYRATVNSCRMPEGCRRCTHNVHRDFRRKDIWDLRKMDLGIYTEKHAQA